jgi:hypothetical protein
MRLIWVVYIHDSTVQVRKSLRSRYQGILESRLALRHSLTGHTRHAAKPPRCAWLLYGGKIVVSIKQCGH